MREAARLALFLGIVLATWALEHAYLYRRAAPFLGPPGSPLRRAGLVALFLASLLYPLGRVAARLAPGRAAYAAEFAGAVWMGLLFLAVAFLLAVDLGTLFGRLAPRTLPALRLGALAASLLLGAFAMVQGLRPPAVTVRPLPLPGLPPSLAGKTLLVLSDLHLGTLLGRRWLSRLGEEIADLDPDILVVAGDLVDGHVPDVEPLVPLLQAWRAPLGKFAVLGNHEFYGGAERAAGLLSRAGFRVLRQEAVEVSPGLFLAGVDDLTARRQFRLAGDPLAEALRPLPAGRPCILLSHSPLGAEEAAARGASAMVSGHTHGGQIWPFGLAVRLFYPRLAGAYTVGPLSLYVCRGTGTWGPPMRLFRRGEVVLFKLEPRGATP
ncbi:MAG: metallophosphoesterase [Acidobacteriota bacterium]